MRLKIKLSKKAKDKT